MARKIVTDEQRRTARRNTFIGIGAGCGVLLFLGVALVLVGLSRLSAKPPPPPEARYSQGSQGYGAPSLEQQVRDVERAAASGTPQPVQLVVGAQDLTRSIAGDLRGQGVEDFELHLGDGTAVAQGKVKLQGREMYAQIRLRPMAKNGKVSLEVQNGKVGTFAMPSQMLNDVQTQIDKALEKNPPQGRNLWVDTIEISAGRLIMRGRTMGRQ